MKKMKIVLQKSVQGVGQAGDIKEVARGYAQNFLIPKGLAVEATQGNIAQAEAIKEKAAMEAKADLEKSQKMAATMEGITVNIEAKASETGTLYAAISPSKIVSALKEKGFDLKKEQIKVEHIKEIGEHEVVINLDHGLEARITLMVSSA